MLYREPKLLKDRISAAFDCADCVSVLYREPKLLKGNGLRAKANPRADVSVLYREPKLLKGNSAEYDCRLHREFQCSTVSRNC